MDLEDFRRDYLADGLQRKDLDVSPFVQFEQWLRQAIATGLKDPTAMSVATVDANGKPWQRLVLLKHCDAEGFVFYTNLDSRKAHARIGMLEQIKQLLHRFRCSVQADLLDCPRGLRHAARIARLPLLELPVRKPTGLSRFALRLPVSTHLASSLQDGKPSLKLLHIDQHLPADPQHRPAQPELVGPRDPVPQGTDGQGRALGGQLLDRAEPSQQTRGGGP